MPHLGIFGLNFEKKLSYLRSEPSNLSTWKNSWKNENSKIGTKNVLFGYFLAKNTEPIIIFQINTLQFGYIQSFAKKSKNTWICDQNCLIWAFFPNSFKKLLSYFKSVPLSLPNSKILNKARKPKFWTKNALFLYFWTVMLKKLLLYLKSAPLNLS